MMTKLPIGIENEHLPSKIDFSAVQRHMKKAYGLELQREIPIVEKEASPIRDPYAVATAGAKKMGYKDFAEGSEGRAKRDEIAEALKKSVQYGRGGQERINKDLGTEYGPHKKIKKYMMKQHYGNMGSPPGVPPRAGLMWNPTSRRWVKMNNVGRMYNA